MSVTDIAAWWGATIATLVLVWDIFKWTREGPRLRLEARTDMQLRTTPALANALDDETYVAVVVTNVGDRPTTITHVLGKHYANTLDRLRRRPKSQFICLPMNTSGGHARLPHVLPVGEQWTGLLQQCEMKKMNDEGGSVVCGIVHSASTREQMRRLRFRN